MTEQEKKIEELEQTIKEQEKKIEEMTQIIRNSYKFEVKANNYRMKSDRLISTLQKLLQNPLDDYEYFKNKECNKDNYECVLAALWQMKITCKRLYDFNFE